MLTVEHLTKSYGAPSGRRLRRRPKAAPGSVPRAHAVNDVSLKVHAGELLTLLGPSGCGKTTTLRSIAGLEHPDGGRIALQDRVLFDRTLRVNVPANKRNLGMVFQSYAIWPHMSVWSNVAFPLQVLPRRRRPDKAEIDERVRAMLAVTELDGYADRPATTLSGGQQQRLALARSLVMQPAVMLLDEPLSNLDARLRESMRFELKRLQRELGLTAVYVTHDQAEALMLSSRIAVMHEGEVVQVGTPREVYLRPGSKFVAEFIGSTNIVSGVVRDAAGSDVTIDTTDGTLRCHSPVRLGTGATVLASIRPECITLSAEQPVVNGGWTNRLRGRVLTRAFLGDSTDYVVVVGERQWRVRAGENSSYDTGAEVYLGVPGERITLIPS